MQCPTFAVTLPSEMRMLSVARTFVEAACQTVPMDRSVLHALVLVTGEAVSNIVRHAHRNLTRAQFQVRIEIWPDRLVLTFEDQGDPFDLSSVPNLNPGELRIGGRGVYMIRKLMDEVTCQPRDAGRTGNSLRLVKRWAPLPSFRNCG